MTVEMVLETMSDSQRVMIETETCVFTYDGRNSLPIEWNNEEVSNLSAVEDWIIIKL